MNATRDKRYVKVAGRYGCRAGLARVIIKWARGTGCPLSLAFALVEHESGFRKVFGHDPTIFTGAGQVTKSKYLRYKVQRGPAGQGGMQGVGEGQLTWYETQDLADKLGGCWTADANVRVALTTLTARIRENGYVVGIERYNGSGPAAVRYSRDVRALAAVWHQRLMRVS